MKYRVGVETETWWDRSPDPDDGWDIGDRTGRISRIFLVKTDYESSYYNAETEEEPPFYAVYADYQTGCTFGSDYEATVVGITETLEEALDLQKEAETFEGFGELSNGFYVPWNGYFERLHGVYIEKIEVPTSEDEEKDCW